MGFRIYGHSCNGWVAGNYDLLSEHGKYLLMAPSIDRSGALGFRCVQDAQSRKPTRTRGVGIGGRGAGTIARGEVRLYQFTAPDKKRPALVLARN